MEGSNTSQLGELIKSNRNAILIGFVITLTATLILFRAELWIPIFSEGRFNPIVFATNTIGFMLAWLVITFLVARASVWVALGVFALLLVVIVCQEYLRLPLNNPISLPALILFWLGMSYVLLPDFIKKYRFVIGSLYGLMLVYFFIFRTSEAFEEVHLQLIGYFVTASASFTFVLWIYQQLNWLINLKLNQTHTELALLKSQIDPHFFFNTLNNLYGLVVEKSEQAPEVVLKLSDMMRYTIYEGKKDLVSLADEIDYLNAYIELHEIRYQKKVDIRFNQEVKGEVKVAPLLFIILLENAFKHGVESLTEQAFIHLELQADEKHVEFTIANNYEAPKRKRKAGIGLDNLKKRLAYIYPNKHQLKIERPVGIFRVKLNIQIH